MRRCKGPCQKVYHKKCSLKLQQSGICEICLKIDNLGCATKTQVDPKQVSIESLLKKVNIKLSIIYKMEKSLEDLTDTVDGVWFWLGGFNIRTKMDRDSW